MARAGPSPAAAGPHDIGRRRGMTAASMPPRKALELIPAIHRSTHQIGLLLRDLAKLDVDQGEAHILAHLADHGDSTIADLHKAFGHRRSTLTSILDRLADRRLVERQT